jgi:pimeloyl-ACP methyl ester carboxylesterase
MIACYSDSMISDPAAFFPKPPKVDLGLRPVRAGVWEAAWPSAFEPFLPELRDKYLSRIENRTARARFYMAGSPDAQTTRPAVIAVHGYMAGQWLFEENVWPIKWLLRRGLDVVLPVLPQHAGRAGPRRGLPAFPSRDPRLTNEGFRQAVTDIRSIIAFLRERGAPHVGVMGMSLGGYTTALLGTIAPDIDFIAPMIPLASIADFAREQGQLGSSEQGEREHAGLERANWVASPFARPSLVPSHRALVIAAEFDRVTPLPHARRLATHFDCELMTIPGGHLLQVGRGAAFRAVGALLEREKIITPPRSRA